MELALAKAEGHDLVDERGGEVGLGDHVLARDAEVDVAFANEPRNVGRGQEHTVPDISPHLGDTSASEPHSAML